MSVDDYPCFCYIMAIVEAEEMLRSRVSAGDSVETESVRMSLCLF